MYLRTRECGGEGGGVFKSYFLVQFIGLKVIGDFVPVV